MLVGINEALDAPRFKTLYARHALMRRVTAGLLRKGFRFYSYCDHCDDRGGVYVFYIVRK